MTKEEAAALVAEAVAALKANGRDVAAGAVRKLIEGEAPLGQQWGAIGRMAAALGEIELADRAMSRFTGGAPNDAERAIARAALLAEGGRVDEALAVLERLTPGAGSIPPVMHLKATLDSQLGRFDAARALFDRTLEKWPLSGHSWLGLAAIHTYSGDDPELARLEAQREAMGAASPDAQGAYFYALGKAYDDVGRADEAFAAFAEGAALIRPSRPYDRAAAEQQVSATIAGFDGPALSSLAADAGVTTRRPLFVTGIPRSGTTLVEQMLASHRDVDGGGEINLFAHVLRRIGGNSIDAARSHVSRNGGAQKAWRGLAELYLHLLRQRVPGDGRAVDKTLTSGRSLGLISLVLPEAPLVWVRRDPLDIAWSCFKTMFSRGVAWSWSQEDIAHHIRLEERLLAHWSAVLGPRLLVLDYEELVARPDEEAARLLDHCGLPQASLREFDKTERAVTTSSAAQVRRPLYRGAIGAAERYRQHLQPFIAAYQAEGRR